MTFKLNTITFKFKMIVINWKCTDNWISDGCTGQSSLPEQCRL